MTKLLIQKQIGYGYTFSMAHATNGLTFATMLSNRKASCLMDSPFFTPFLQAIFKQDGFLITEVAAFHNTSPAPNDKYHTHADFVFVYMHIDRVGGVVHDLTLPY